MLMLTPGCDMLHVSVRRCSRKRVMLQRRSHLMRQSAPQVISPWIVAIVMRGGFQDMRCQVGRAMGSMNTLIIHASHAVATMLWCAQADHAVLVVVTQQYCKVAAPGCERSSTCFASSNGQALSVHAVWQHIEARGQWTVSIMGMLAQDAHHCSG